MKIAIIGSNNLTIENLAQYIPKNTEIDEIISGGARCITSCAKSYALRNNIPFTEIALRPNLYGEFAPAIQNLEMITPADHVYIFWDKESHRTKSVIDFCYKTNKPCTVYEFNLARADWLLI